MEDVKPFNPLTNKTVIVRFIPKLGKITDTKHVLYGGMAENAKKVFTVPVLESSQSYVNVLTNDEKKFFEELFGGINMGAYEKNGKNYWDNYKVELTKGDNILHLNDPEEYIKFKVLLANKQFICPSPEAYERRPLATYQFLITSDEAEIAASTRKRNVKSDCYKWLGKHEADFDLIKAVLEMLDGRPLSADTDIRFIQNTLDKKIEEDSSKFYQIISNAGLPIMVLVKKSVGNGLIVQKGDFYYKKNGRALEPLCDSGENPDMQHVVKYLSNPKNQELKFALEAQSTTTESPENNEGTNE